MKVGNKAVDFSLEDSQGNLTSLSDFEGNIIILNFWASWCPPCVKEMPDLMEVGKKYEDNGVSVVAINRTTIEIQPEDAEEFLEDENIELFVLYDIEDEVSNLYNIPGVPVTLIIDQDFKVIKRINGEVNEEILIAEIEELL
ncbi:TlpA disulfide reductase family protein [Bacillus sp. JCM 19034]|uniref:TlpA disulfide reductase family protein n=1 Tax=Bacillus sp. JCM 19034 TaxID=1481928 RepID=UPI000A4F2FD2|nr:TlpA disulfide reductase family protein [Bacillus sp. JCM 19034]